MIEKVILTKTLKAGQKVWEEGTVLEAPLPPDILNEIYAQTGLVKVIQGEPRSEAKLVFVAERVKETATSMTTMATKHTPIEEVKSKPTLRRRQ